jgi:hypothetical protein
MNRKVVFNRKVTYVGVIALLLFPLFRLGQPATRGTGGGWLAGLRKDFGLAQAQLGEIDSTSETMKLVTLGMRGVAANVLWFRQAEYQKKEDWDNVRATLNQITTLQPNFINVWEYQAHNLSYNISVEFDDYRYRYHWVKKGIDFLIDGSHFNSADPTLLRWTGWYTSHKIGKSDEKLEFRELFRGDRDWHSDLLEDIPIESREALGPDGRPDCWQVGRIWHGMSEDAVAAGHSMRGRAPLIFYSDGPLARINYAQSIEDEGWLGEQAQTAWQIALDDLHRFGRRELPTSWGHYTRLDSFYELLKERDAYRSQLDALVPGLRDEIRQLKEEALDHDERVALQTDMLSRTERQMMLVAMIPEKLEAKDSDVVDRLPTELKPRGVSLMAKVAEAQTLLEHCDRYRNIVNYGYWEMRCEAEQTADAVNARKHVYQALERLKKTDLVNAKQEFELAWEYWANVFRDFPALMDDVTGEDLNESINKYEHVLLQMGLTGLPPDFKLKELRSKRKAAERRGPPTGEGQPPTANLQEIPQPGAPIPVAPPRK